MKSKDEIENVLRNVDSANPKYFGMSYEQGVEEALQWVLDEIPNEDFEYTKED